MKTQINQQLQLNDIQTEPTQSCPLAPPTQGGQPCQSTPSPQNKHNQSQTKKEKMLTIVNRLLIAIIILLLTAIILFVFVITPMKVSGNSMQNTLQNNDKIVILKVGNKLQRGDIVVFKKPSEKQPPIKRIIAVGGEVVKFDVTSNHWTINGVQLEETYAFFDNNGCYALDYFALTNLEVKTQLLGEGLKVGDDELFVLGDNRNISYDSHIYGCIKTDWIKGKLLNQSKYTA
ncbi:MAG: signal peptidase I [Clostridia bacterium]